MKTLLGCLMCLVFTVSQTFAIHGDPWGGSGHVTVTGTYAGTFVPIPDPMTGMTDNSLALFTLIVPTKGLAQGTSAIFRNGFFYSGTIQGSADPQSAKVTGIINGTFMDTVESGTETVTNNYYASGQFENAQIVASSSFFISGIRLKGTAMITYIPGSGFTPDPRGDSNGPITYKVHGFKQAEATS